MVEAVIADLVASRDNPLNEGRSGPLADQKKSRLRVVSVKEWEYGIDALFCRTVVKGQGDQPLIRVAVAHHIADDGETFGFANLVQPNSKRWYGDNQCG